MRTVLLILLIICCGQAQTQCLRTLIIEHAVRADISTQHALAIALEGSGFDPAHRGPNGSVGLMAVLPELAASTVAGSAAWLDEPVTNVSVAVRLLARLWREHGDWSTVLTVYHSGSTKASPATRRWVNQVLTAAHRRSHPHTLGRHGCSCNHPTLDDFPCPARQALYRKRPAERAVGNYCQEVDARDCRGTRTKTLHPLGASTGINTLPQWRAEVLKNSMNAEPPCLT